jgi:hypothetical protein
MQVLFLLTFISLFISQLLALASQQAARKVDPYDNKGNTPFFLQDPYDQMCLGPNGFTTCDENALWILTKRSGKSTYSLVSLLSPSNNGGLCLQRKLTFLGLMNTDVVSIGSCSRSSAKSWNFEFVDQTHVKLSANGQCLVRGKKQFKNSVSVQNCQKGEFIPLVYHPTAVHENGFYLKGADDTCFDGSKFRSCEGAGSNKLLWGVGVRYDAWTAEAKRYIFSFNVQDRANCLISRGSKVEKGLCSDRAAVTWAMGQGKLMFGKAANKCLARNADDSGVMVDCAKMHEYLTIEVPSLYTNEQLMEMLQNPVRYANKWKQNKVFPFSLRLSNARLSPFYPEFNATRKSSAGRGFAAQKQC